MNNETIFQFFGKLEAMLNTQDRKLDVILKWCKDEKYEIEDDELPQKQQSSRQRSQNTMSDEFIIQNGEQIPYNLLSIPEQVEAFRRFIFYIRSNEHLFNPMEYRYAGFADKTFEDVRLSDNHIRILERAYTKAYQKQWPFKFIKGFMYKMNMVDHDEIAWEWN
jgi:hypothetical protein